MSKRVHLSEASNDEELKLLIEKFIRISEELEKKESDVFKNVQMVQSAVASLQAWKQNGESLESLAVSNSLDLHEPSVHIDTKQIEEETKMIREETGRIQQEIKEKIEENKRLKETVDRRNALLASIALRNLNRMEIESWRPSTSSRSRDLTYDPGIDILSEKADMKGAQEKKPKKMPEVQTERTKKTERTTEEDRATVRVDRELFELGRRLPRWK